MSIIASAPRASIPPVVPCRAAATREAPSGPERTSTVSDGATSCSKRALESARLLTLGASLHGSISGSVRSNGSDLQMRAHAPRKREV